MATTVHLEDMDDLVVATLRDLGRSQWVQVAQELQNYEVMSRWLKDDKIVMSDGYGVQKNVMLKTGDTAGHHGMFHRDNVNITDLMAQVRMNFVHADSFWAYETREMMANKGKSRVTNVIEPKRAGAMIDLAAELETTGWAAPNAALSTLPYGIRYWVVQNATAAVGFNGGAASGFTTVGGINPTTNTRWKNCTGTFAAYTRADMITKLKRVFRKIRWRSPVTTKEMELAEDLRVYTTETVVEAFETLAEAQNENLGNDVASKAAGSSGRSGIRMEGDQVTIRRHPIIYVPELEATVTNDPIYCIDHGTFKVYVMSGDYLRETGPIMAQEQHNTRIVWVDLTYNYLCLNRRRNGVLYKV